MKVKLKAKYLSYDILIVSKKRKKILSGASEHIKIGGYKIARRKKSDTNSEYNFYIVYRDIDTKFWNDIYQAFDTLYPKGNLDIFLDQWNEWYVDLTKIYNHNQNPPFSAKDHKAIDAPEYETLSYPSPWKDGLTKEQSEKLSKFSLEERWQFIQTLKPPTQNSSYAKRIIGKDFLKRERRDKCKYANVYSILLLKTTYFTWLKQNAEPTTSIDQIYLSISIDNIVRKISKVNYKEFVFCGTIPLFVLSDYYLQHLQSHISDEKKNAPVLYTLIVLYPSLENIDALFKLRRITKPDIARDIFNTYKILFENMQFLRDKGVYVRVLYIDQLLPYDIYLLDSEICLVSFESGIYPLPLNGFRETDPSTSTRTLLYLDSRNNEQLLNKFTLEVYNEWFRGLRAYALSRFICTKQFNRELCSTIRRVRETILGSNIIPFSNANSESRYTVKKEVSGLPEELVTHLTGECGYLPPANHPFRENYKFLLENREKDLRYADLLYGSEVWGEYERYIDIRMIRRLNKMYVNEEAFKS